MNNNSKMEKHTILIILLSLLLIVFETNVISNAQVRDPNQMKKRNTEKEAEQNLTFFRIDSLLNSRQFVFQAEFNQGSDMVFVVVDSSYGEVQDGNRNNLQGHITQYEVKKNEKKKTLSVTIKMRGVLSTADVFIFIGTDRNGKATVKSEFPGYFSFYGNVVEFENANIYEGPSHFVH